MKTLCLVVFSIVLACRVSYATDTTPPNDISDLTATVGRTTIALNWTSAGDDGTSGCADYFELRYSSGVINSGNFGSATLISYGPPACPRATECGAVSSLASCSLYYFAIKSRDEASNWSNLTIITATTNCSGGETACP